MALRPSAALWLGVLALSCLTWPAAADDLADALRPCRRADVIGVWAMVRLGTATSAHVDRADPAFYPYQRFAFRSDASLRHLAAAAPVGPEEERTLLSAPTTVTWSVDDKGRLLTRKDATTAPEIDACQVLLAKVSDPRSPVPGFPGDLLLTHYSEDGKPIARRLLRKIARSRE